MQLVSIGLEFSLRGDTTVRTDQLTAADSSIREYPDDYDDSDELPKMDT